jgi:predicted metal-dependent enzyme (double-stranded beta helix superfamily)
MTVSPHSERVHELIRRLDEAVGSAPDDETRCRNVKRALTDVVSSGQDFVDEPFLKPAPNKYARRLLHRDPAGRYTALVMVWDKARARRSTITPVTGASSACIAGVSA